MNTATLRSRTITEFRQLGLDHGHIDKVNGVIHDVSLITSGVEARGHDLHTDDVTLEQVCCLATEMGQVPVKWNHQTGADSVNGYVSNFRVMGNKTKADWHLLKTHPNYDQAIELAERMPGNVGLSVAFVPAPPEQKNGRKCARVEELVAVDLVAQPAANPDGLFEAVDNLRGDKPMNPNNPNPAATAAAAAAAANQPEPTTRELLDAIQGQSQTIAALQEQVTGLVNASQANEPLSIEQLQEIAQLDDAELAKLNLTRDEVDSAVADAMAGVEDPDQIDAGDGPIRGVVRAPGRDFVAGEGGQGGVRAAQGVPAAVTAELSDLRRTVNFMVRDRKLARQSAEAEALETFFSKIEEKVTTLQTENETLLAANQALQTAFEAGGGHVSANGEFKMPPGALPGGGNHAAGEQTEFEQLVDAKIVELSEKSPELSSARMRVKAIQFVQKENRAAYNKHLEAVGVQIVSL